MKAWVGILILFFTLPSLLARADSSATKTSTETYEGHQILVAKQLTDSQSVEVRKAIDWIKWELFYIKNVFPEASYKAIKNTRIVLTTDNPKLPKIAFHPSVEWFVNNGFSETEAKLFEKSIVISDIKNFSVSREFQKFMILHEMAHAVFFAKLTDEKFKRVQSLFEKAKAKGLYKKVLHYNGFKLQSYAYSDLAEYFAEGSESYFSLNDFFPFNRAELKSYDPELFSFLVEYWGDQESYYFQFLKNYKK